MFPRLDREVIESVLRSNNGAVDVTIDQLLVLDEDTDSLEPSSSLGSSFSSQVLLYWATKHAISIIGIHLDNEYELC